MAKPLDGLKTALDQDDEADEQGGTITLPMHNFFMTADEGPARCDNCREFDNGKCRNDYVITHHGEDVDPAECCDFFRSLKTKEPS